MAEPEKPAGNLRAEKTGKLVIESNSSNQERLRTEEGSEPRWPSFEIIGG
jgi:hypothetical protein